MNRATKSDSWVRNPDGTLGFTCNVITGCLKHCSYCFAMKTANGRCQERYLANDLKAPPFNGLKPLDDPFWPRFWPERLEEIYQRKKPAGIFLNIMGEWAGDWVPVLWQKEMFDCIRACPQHRFYLLTKQPQNLIKWSPYPPNVYIGVSVCDQPMLAGALVGLAPIEAKVKFISFEPLLKQIYFHPPYNLAGISWAIIGQQTPTSIKTSPRMLWIQEILVAASNAGNIPIFMKDNLESLLVGQWAGWELRQEVP